MVVCPGGEETRPTGSSVLSLLIQDSVLTLLLSCLCAKKRPVRLWGEETPLVTTLVRFSNRLLLSYGDFIWETLCSLLQGGSTIVSFYVFCTVHTYPFIASWSVKKQSPMLWVLSLFVWPLSFNFLLLLISKETVTNAQCAFCQVRWPCGQKLKSKNTLSDGKKIFLRPFFLCCFRKKTLKLVSLFIFRH